jgi:NDP-sugar pyrophosphorylase family protein
MSKPIIVVLAAGMGSRYGGLKQMDKIGKSGEVLLDYSVFDAKRAGFGKAVFIIRRDIETDFREIVLSRIAGNFPCELAFQEMDSLIPPNALSKSKEVNRTKPWGTTHALLCARDLIDTPFIVINADDFYGHEAFDAMGSFFAAGPVNEGAIVPYRLEKTLSQQGTVTRGICEVKDGYLAMVDELTAIAREKDGKIYNTGADGSKRYLPNATPVSMNFWGFPPTIFDDIQRYFDDFLAESAGQPKAECYLPMAADWLIKNGLLKIRALEADAPWFGVTYKEDREAAINRVAEYTAAGIYPETLWAA